MSAGSANGQLFLESFDQIRVADIRTTKRDQIRISIGNRLIGGLRGVADIAHQRPAEGLSEIA